MKRLSSLPPEIERTIKPEVFNDAYLPYLNVIKSREVYYGGGSAGKSIFISDKLFLQLSAIPNRNAIILRKTQASCRLSCYKAIRSSMNKFKLAEAWNVVEHPIIEMTNLINKNTIVFLGMDDVEKIKSITFENGPLTDIWYEEISEETDLQSIYQLEVRLRGGKQKKRLIVSYNPVSVNHFIKKLAEVEWKAKFGDELLYLHTTYKDNKFLEPEDIANLEYFKYSSPYMYQVYVLGQYGTMGQSVFARELISERLSQLATIHFNDSPKRCNFSYERDDNNHVLKDSLTMFHADHGDITIYRDVDVRVPYVLAYDPAGDMGEDFHAAHVLNNLTGEQVAVYHAHEEAAECTYQLYGLCKHYNNALFVPEVNFSTIAMTIFKEWGYTNIYQRGKPSDAYSDGYVQKQGFTTTNSNRNDILNYAIDFVKNNVDLINDPDTLNEMISFTLQEKAGKKARMEAESGSHDDLVMSYAIALKGREQCSRQMSREQQGSLTGTWSHHQLESALEAGRITREQKKEYEKNHPGHVVFSIGQASKLQRRNRYDR